MHDLSHLRNALAGPLAPLKQYRQFVLWRLETNDKGQPTKVPYAVDGRHGSSTNPATWCDADTALMYAHSGQMGVGFVLTDADPFRVIDIDHCLIGGAWSELALRTINQFPGAAVEVSQSGEGLHIWLQGALPARHGNKGAGIELYARERFIALTGYGVNAATSAAASFDNLASFVTVNFPPRQHVSGELNWQNGPIAEAGNVPASDDDLLRAFLSQPAATPRVDAYQAFAHLTGRDAVQAERVPVANADLFNANVAVLAQAWPSDKGDAFDKSNAAFALACRLAMWTGKDCPRIERLMNRAAFQRTRAEQDRVRGQTYMQWDIMRACAAMPNVRKWNAADANAEVKQQGATGYQAFYDRISSAGDVQTIRAIAEEAGYDLSIDQTYRKLLAGHINKQIGLLGERLPMADCERLIAVRSTHPAPDRQALQRQANIAMSLAPETVTLTPVMSTAQMLNDFVFIADGSQIGSVSDRHICFSFADLRNLMAASRSVSVDGKEREHIEDWRTHAARHSVMTRTFKAGDKILTTDPNGLPALNMWRARGAQRVYSVDISPFLEHIDYLFGADASNFLDWLAHIEQQPGVLPHHGFLHIAKNTGTGRTWLGTLVTKLWLGYVAPSVDMAQLINGGFNGMLSGRVLAYTDEIRAGGSENAYLMESKIRSLVTESVRPINPKYGRQYYEFNSCRWLLFSNHKDAIPMNDDDRRWYVVYMAGSPRSDATYAYLYTLLNNPAFVDSIGAWLAQRDISGFNPGVRPPMTDAKKLAISSSKSEYQKRAEQVAAAWPCDFITVADMLNVFADGDMMATGKRMVGAMRHAMDDIGMHCVESPVYDDRGNKVRCWLVRNIDAWLQPGVLCKDNTMSAFAAYRQHQKMTAYETLLSKL